MRIREIIEALENFSPLSYQDDYDNSGLQLGLTDVKLTGVLLCLDVTEAVIEEAANKGCNLIVSHHPLLFKGLKKITADDYVGRCVMKAIRCGITVYAAHTNLDNAYGGVSYGLAGLLGLKNARPLASLPGEMLKLVIYVPASHSEKLREALFAAGCGATLRYDSCSYSLNGGTGTFRPLDDARPYAGYIGEMYSSEETRLEMILPRCRRGDALKAIYSAHPYEEPAYEFTSLENDFSAQTGNGSGVIGDIDEMPVDDFLRKVSDAVGAGCLRHSRFSKDCVTRVAICGGAGSFLIPRAVSMGADAFLTGEIKHHEFLGREHEILLIEAGHYETEQHAKGIFRAIISDVLSERGVADVHVFEYTDDNPIKYFR